MAGISSGQMSRNRTFLYLKDSFIKALFCHVLTNEIALLCKSNSMKAQLFIISATLFLTTTSFNSIQVSPVKTALTLKQADASFVFLRTHRQGKGVAATWAVNTGNVASFTVKRTYEDPADPYAFWEDVSTVPGGSGRSFKYTDESVFPGYVNYKIVALMDDGSSIVSEVATVRIVSH
jgi:hypothetical protein